MNDPEFDKYRRQMKEMYERLFPAPEPDTEPAPNAPIVHFTPETLTAGEPVRLETPNEEERCWGYDVPPVSPEDTQEITPLYVEDDTDD